MQGIEHAYKNTTVVKTITIWYTYKGVSTVV